MSQFKTIVIPGDTGDQIARSALSHARHAALQFVSNRWADDPFNQGLELGMALGEICIARGRLDVDPILAAAARNEAKFLLCDYVTRWSNER